MWRRRRDTRGRRERGGDICQSFLEFYGVTGRAGFDSVVGVFIGFAEVKGVAIVQSRGFAFVCMHGPGGKGEM